MGCLKMLKREYLEKGTWVFSKVKKFLTCASDDFEDFEEFSFCGRGNLYLMQIKIEVIY